MNSLTPTLALVALAAAVEGAPHIVVILGDDVGWHGVGFHAKRNATEQPLVRTPRMDALVAEGMELDRHYVYKFCSPSRSSFQSGRLPVHVNVANAAPELRNASDPVSGYAGIPKSMTGVASVLSASPANYSAHMTGKWDAGMATPQHTPMGRGYSSWLGYYHHANDYYTEGLPLQATGNINVCLNQFTDLWGPGQGPAVASQGLGVYEEEIFTNQTLSVIHAHAEANRRAAAVAEAPRPLFLVHAFHLVHTPLEVPDAYLEKFSKVPNPTRRKYLAMTKYMDDVVGKIVDALDTEDMWEDTLLVFMADNGGAIYNPAGGNNYPLRGGKYADWEGGVRGVAFVAGGYLPESKRGTRSGMDRIFHIADWYRTFASIAGVKDPEDAPAKRDGLPPVDGVDQSGVLLLGPGVISDDGSDPRELHISTNCLLSGRYKLVTGVQPMTGWTGPSYPNNTGSQPSFFPKGWKYDAGDGELYDVVADETEHHNLASTHPDVLARLQQRLKELNGKSFFNPGRGTPDRQACVQAKKYGGAKGGTYGPWVFSQESVFERFE